MSDSGSRAMFPNTYIHGFKFIQGGESRIGRCSKFAKSRMAIQLTTFTDQNVLEYAVVRIILMHARKLDLIYIQHQLCMYCTRSSNNKGANTLQLLHSSDMNIVQTKSSFVHMFPTYCWKHIENTIKTFNQDAVSGSTQAHSSGEGHPTSFSSWPF